MVAFRASTIRSPPPMAARTNAGGTEGEKGTNMSEKDEKLISICPARPPVLPGTIIENGNNFVRTNTTKTPPFVSLFDNTLILLYYAQWFYNTHPSILTVSPPSYCLTRAPHPCSRGFQPYLARTPFPLYYLPIPPFAEHIPSRSALSKRGKAQLLFPP